MFALWPRFAYSIREPAYITLRASIRMSYSDLYALTNEMSKNGIDATNTWTGALSPAAGGYAGICVISAASWGVTSFIAWIAFPCVV